MIVQNGVQAREKEHEKYMHENRNTRKTLEYDATAEGEWVERGRGHGRVAASGKEERLAQAEKELGASTGTCGDEATRQDTTSARAPTATPDTHHRCCCCSCCCCHDCGCRCCCDCCCDC